jgi:hypothetical protein
MLLRFIFLIICALPFVATPACAAEYADATWQNLTRALVRFNAINLSDQQIVDEYAIITECDLYTAFYRDDFKWNKVRQAVRESVKNNVATFPMSFHYDVKLQLDHYDFDQKIFRFAEKSRMLNINTFTLLDVQGNDCGTTDVKLMPRVFRAVLAAPLYLDGLPLGENDGQALLKQMKAEYNINRYIYARFNLSVVYVEMLRKSTFKSGFDTITRLQQSGTPLPQTVRLDIRLDSIDFYQDTHLAHLIFHYQP